MVPDGFLFLILRACAASSSKRACCSALFLCCWPILRFWSFLDFGFLSALCDDCSTFWSFSTLCDDWSVFWSISTLWDDCSAFWFLSALCDSCWSGLCSVTVLVSLSGLLCSLEPPELPELPGLPESFESSFLLLSFSAFTGLCFFLLFRLIFHLHLWSQLFFCLDLDNQEAKFSPF